MKKYFFLALLTGCGQDATEHQATKAQLASEVLVSKSVPSTKTAGIYCSGDRETSGPADTLRVGNGLVLHLRPGSKSDFAPEPRSAEPYSEARIIRQAGNGRVSRSGHTLVVRPYNGNELRFSDDTYQIRKDENEETDTRCHFGGSLPGRPYWLVDSLQWERYQPFLINKNSGLATLLAYEPAISPNRQRLFVATPGLDRESSLNGLQLLAVSNQTVNSLWTRALANWQPQRVRWLDNRTIAIEQVRFEPQESTTYIRLILPN